MTPFFWIQAVVVLIGLVLCAVNIYDSYRDIRCLRDDRSPLARDAIIVAYAWLVRTAIKLLVMLVYMTFNVMFLYTRTTEATANPWVVLMEIRSLWVAGLIVLLCGWDKLVRVKLSYTEHPLPVVECVTTTKTVDCKAQQTT